jgi:XTP/dITP diphosphohydrolase
VSGRLVRPGPELVLATSNPGKLSELRALLADLPFAMLTLDAFPTVRLPEEGDDYEANAVAKARAVARSTARAALADDSGLEVAALGGAPGARSARFGGLGLDDAARVAKLLEAIGPARDRRACFVCIAAFALPGGEAITARGECRGRILNAPRGRGGFGYDPVFEPEGYASSMAELLPHEKNAISHRARAVAELLPTLRERLIGAGAPPRGCKLASER